MCLNHFGFRELQSLTRSHFLENSFNNRCFSTPEIFIQLHIFERISYFVRPHMSNFGRSSYRSSFIRVGSMGKTDDSSSIDDEKFIFDGFENQLFE